MGRRRHWTDPQANILGRFLRMWEGKGASWELQTLIAHVSWTFSSRYFSSLPGILDPSFFYSDSSLSS